MAQPTPLRAIRLKCLDCSNNQPLEVKNCTITDCPLYYYRLGKNPKRKGMGNPEAFKKYRESQAKNCGLADPDKPHDFKTKNERKEAHRPGTRPNYNSVT
jgi:hypothetical protein